VYCWGEIGQPPLRGPYLKLQFCKFVKTGQDYYYGLIDPSCTHTRAIVLFQQCCVIGLYENNTIITWGEGPTSEVLNKSVSVVDFVRASFPILGRSCVIDMNGVLMCYSLPRTHDEQEEFPPLFHLDTLSINETHLLSGDGATTLSLIIDGQVIIGGGHYNSYRIGGHAMQPRKDLRRVIQIASDGDDKPWCGQRYFKPCATFAYTQQLQENVGSWVTSTNTRPRIKLLIVHCMNVK
jgi:hypothetical protein